MVARMNILNVTIHPKGLLGAAAPDYQSTVPALPARGWISLEAQRSGAGSEILSLQFFRPGAQGATGKTAGGGSGGGRMSPVHTIHVHDVNGNMK